MLNIWEGKQEFPPLFFKQFIEIKISTTQGKICWWQEAWRSLPAEQCTSLLLWYQRLSLLLYKMFLSWWAYSPTSEKEVERENWGIKIKSNQRQTMASSRDTVRTRNSVPWIKPHQKANSTLEHVPDSIPLQFSCYSVWYFPPLASELPGLINTCWNTKDIRKLLQESLSLNSDDSRVDIFASNTGLPWN